MKLICLVGFAIVVVTIGLFGPSLMTLCRIMMLVGAGVRAYASLRNLQRFVRLVEWSGPLAASGDLTGA